MYTNVSNIEFYETEVQLNWVEQKKENTRNNFKKVFLCDITYGDYYTWHEKVKLSDPEKTLQIFEKQKDYSFINLVDYEDSIPDYVQPTDNRIKTSDRFSIITEVFAIELKGETMFIHYGDTTEHDVKKINFAGNKRDFYYYNLELIKNACTR